MQQQRRVDGGDLVGRHLQPVVDNAGLQIGRQHRDAIDDAAAPAEADNADLAGGFHVLLQERHGGCDAARGVAGIERADHVAGLVLIGRRAAERREHIDRQAEEAFERDAARDVLDVRIETAVLVDDDDGRAFALRFEPRQSAADARAGRVIRYRVDGEPRIVGRDHRGAGVIVLQQRQQRQRRRARSGDLGQPVEEVAAVDAAMREAVVKVDNALIHGRLRRVAASH